MSNLNLSAIAVEVVGNYEQAVRHIARTWETGIAQSTRLGEERYVRVLQSLTGRLVNEATTSNLISAQQRVSKLLAARVQAGTNVAAAAAERISLNAREVMGRVATVADGFEGPVARAFSSVALPSARLSLALSSSVSEGARRIEDRVVGYGDKARSAPASAKKGRSAPARSARAAAATTTKQQGVKRRSVKPVAATAKSRAVPQRATARAARVAATR